MRRAANVDGNHAEIVKALRQIGATAVSLAAVGKGVPDILVGYRGFNFLLEAKNLERDRGAPSILKLTAAEQEFHDTWAGQLNVVTTPEQAVLVVVEAARGRELAARPQIVPGSALAGCARTLAEDRSE